MQVKGYSDKRWRMHRRTLGHLYIIPDSDLRNCKGSLARLITKYKEPSAFFEPPHTNNSQGIYIFKRRNTMRRGGEERLQPLAAMAGSRSKPSSRIATTHQGLRNS
ncbi:hypothetical protein O6H91_05G016300 [Diphasiastrum complanatum]|uniref:Uncharacterized protein n=1 Tax=Diphasiastrum complanatum TaxID=34168 RepID=A0ACC2DLN2_DIPCM|nr:hypothetical protein O6H91_05G016300 [Diphasiastrum complanatum]